jgi:hypothetical protein
VVQSQPKNEQRRQMDTQNPLQESVPTLPLLVVEKISSW